MTDSIADVPREFVETLDITVVPCNIHFGQETFRDGIDLTSEEFYTRLKQAKSLPTTSQPSVGVFRETYQRLGQLTKDIVSLHVPAALSGVYNSAAMAAKMLPELRIRVIDSTNISMALGWLTIIAARAAKAGQTLDEIEQLVLETIPRLRLVAVVDTLEYAERGGRIGKATALVGTLLRVKPILEVRDSQVLPVENVRTHRRAIQRLIEIAESMAPFQELAVVHTNDADLAQQVRETLGRLHPVERIPISEVGPVLGAHVGPGAVGVACVVAG